MIEENPFTSSKGAREWIYAVENEKGTARDKEVYPKISNWIKEIQPTTVLEVGCGQGICSTKLEDESIKYIGIDPSAVLIDRANELYKNQNRKFIVADAYSLPVLDGSINACFSVSVWFHLENLDLASSEMSRVLKENGHFMIVTPDPDVYDIWKSFYTNTQSDGNRLIGETRILLNPDQENHQYAVLSKNVFYLHSLKQITESLAQNGLTIDSIEKLGILPISNGKNIFICISGHKA